MISPLPQELSAQNPTASDAWRWPVDLTTHKRPPFFRELELQELDRVMKWRALPRVLPLPLEQLLLPTRYATR